MKKKKAIQKHGKHDATYRIRTHVCGHLPGTRPQTLWEQNLCLQPMAALVPVTELRPDKQGRGSGRPREPRPRSHTSMLAAMGWQMTWLMFCHSFWTLRRCRYNFSATQIPKKHQGSVRSESTKAECSRWSESLFWVVDFPIFQSKIFITVHRPVGV